jgi:hypothetical protein
MGDESDQRSTRCESDRHIPEDREGSLDDSHSRLDSELRSVKDLFYCQDFVVNDCN